MLSEQYFAKTFLRLINNWHLEERLHTCKSRWILFFFACKKVFYNRKLSFYGNEQTVNFVFHCFSIFDVFQSSHQHLFLLHESSKYFLPLIEMHFNGYCTIFADYWEMIANKCVVSTEGEKAYIKWKLLDGFAKLKRLLIKWKIRIRRKFSIFDGRQKRLSL